MQKSAIPKETQSDIQQKDSVLLLYQRYTSFSLQVWL